MTTMTKSERVELGQLIRKRERVMKSMVSERAAAMLLEFESQCAAIYSFDQDEIWERSFKEAERVAKEAQATVAERCKELGIPKEFAPSIHIDWYSRGQNAVASRRAELRKVAKAKIAVVEKEALAKIERMSLDAQTEVIAHGLESDAARGFLERMPSVEVLMPTLNAAELKQLQERKERTHRRGM